MDTSLEAHRAALMILFRTAGLDEEIAWAMHELDGRSYASFPYPDTAGVLRALKERNCRIAIVSDIHYDLRPLFAHYGLIGFIDAWSLSYEHRWVKPAPGAFLAALEALGLRPDEVLMVGDRASHDGGAAAVGIPTLLLPPVANFSQRGLDLVLRLFPDTPAPNTVEIAL